MGKKNKEFPKALFVMVGPLEDLKTLQVVFCRRSYDNIRYILNEFAGTIEEVHKVREKFKQFLIKKQNTYEKNSQSGH